MALILDFPLFCGSVQQLWRWLRELFHDDRAGGGGGEGGVEVGADNNTVNYTVVSSPLADNWTCNHSRRLFSSPRSHAPGRRGADLSHLLTPAGHRSPRPHHTSPPRQTMNRWGNTIA